MNKKVLHMCSWCKKNTHMINRIHAYIRACMYAYIRACMYAYMRACMYAYIQGSYMINGYLHTHTHTWIHEYIHVHKHTHIHIQGSYIHTYIHTHIWGRMDKQHTLAYIISVSLLCTCRWFCSDTYALVIHTYIHRRICTGIHYQWLLVVYMQVLLGALGAFERSINPPNASRSGSQLAVCFYVFVCLCAYMH